MRMPAPARRAVACSRFPRVPAAPTTMPQRKPGTEKSKRWVVEGRTGWCEVDAAAAGGGGRWRQQERGSSSRLTAQQRGMTRLVGWPRRLAPQTHALRRPLSPQAKDAALAAAHAATSEELERSRREQEELALQGSVFEKMLGAKDALVSTLGPQPQGSGQQPAPAPRTQRAQQPPLGPAAAGKAAAGTAPQLRRHPSGAELAAALPMSDAVKQQLQSMTYYPVSFVAQVCGFRLLARVLLHGCLAGAAEGGRAGAV